VTPMSFRRQIRSLLLVCLTIVSVSATAKAQQSVLWHGAVKPAETNVYTGTSTDDPIAKTLKQGNAVDVILEISDTDGGWCRVALSGQTDPLGYMLCLNLERGAVAASHDAPNRPTVTQSPKPKPTQTTTVNPTALTNQDILDMNRTGLSPEILVAKIKSSQCNFDTSPASLQALKAAGLGDSVILAMVEAPNEQPNLAHIADPSSASSSNFPLPKGSAADPKDAAAKLQPGTYYWAGNAWTPMQPITMSGGGAKHVAKAFVPGLTPQVVWTFRDSEALVQIRGQNPLFCVKVWPVMAGTPYTSSARDIVIVRFDKKKDHRELQTTNGGNMFTFKAGLSKDRMPDIDVNTLDVGTYLISPRSPLQVGEYLLSTSSMGLSGYDFGLSSSAMTSQ
jgi:hypothetical protein